MKKLWQAYGSRELAWALCILFLATVFAVGQVVSGELARKPAEIEFSMSRQPLAPVSVSTPAPARVMVAETVPLSAPKPKPWAKLRARGFNPERGSAVTVVTK